MSVNAINLDRCIELLQTAHDAYLSLPKDDPMREHLQGNVVKHFEISQEVLLKLLRRVLQDYGYSGESVSGLPAKGLLRLASEHGFLAEAELERWIRYRNARNAVAHEYGVKYVLKVLGYLPTFKNDIIALAALLRQHLEEDARDGD